MKEYWAKFAVFVDSKTLRERCIILLVVLALVYAVCDVLFLGALIDSGNAKSRQLAALQHSNQGMEQQIAQLGTGVSASLQEHRQQEKQLREKIKRLDAELASAASGFIPAQTMPRVLEEMLARNAGLSVVKMENKPVELVSGSDGGDGASLYRHGVELQLKGSYAASLEYLQTLEQLEWRIHWESLTFDVAEYPAGILVLEMYTFSTERDWLGV